MLQKKMLQSKNSRGLKAAIIILMAVVAFALAAPAGHAYADGAEKCKVTVIVKDKTTGEVIKDAKPLIYSRDPDGYSYKYNPVAPEEDGTFNLNIEDYQYTYKAEAKGYKYVYKYNSQKWGKYVEFDGKTKDEQGKWTLTLNVTLDPQTEEERLNELRENSKKELSGYVKAEAYESEEQEQLKKYIQEYSDKIDAGKTDEEIKGALKEGKAKIDELATLQRKNNDRYFSRVMFTSRDGKKTAILKGEKGNYTATLSLLDKNGVFSVEGDPAARWKVKRTLWSQSIMIAHPFGYIAERTGEFLTETLPPDVEFIDSEINDGEVVLGDGSKVTFKLVVSTKEEDKAAAVANVTKKITEIGEVTLDKENMIKDARREYNGLLKSLQKQVKNYGTLTAAENKLNELKKAKAEEEQKLEKEAKAVDEKISAIGEVTLDKEAAINEARKAYDALSDGAKKKVEKYEDLKAAEKKLEELKKAIAEEEDAKLEKEAKAVDEKISAIGKVTLGSKKAIAGARKAYDALRDEAKKKVKNYKVLTDAEKKFVQLDKAKKKSDLARKKKLPGKVSLKVKAGKKQVTLSWKKTKKAKGYIIYRSTSKNGKYAKVKVIKNGKTLKFINKKLKKGKTYYYKICAFNATGKGPLSAAKKVKVK